jgi:AraC-like DNA-binding protein
VDNSGIRGAGETAPHAHETALLSSAHRVCLLRIAISGHCSPFAAHGYRIGVAWAITAIAYSAGFGDLSYFNRALRGYYGATAREVRNECPRLRSS